MKGERTSVACEDIELRPRLRLIQKLAAESVEKYIAALSLTKDELHDP